MGQLKDRYPQMYLSTEQFCAPAPEALVPVGAVAELPLPGSRAFSGFGCFMALATVDHVPRPLVLVRTDQAAEGEHVPDADGRP